MSGFSRVAEGPLVTTRHGVTILGEAVRGALDLADAGYVDDGVHVGQRAAARLAGIGEVAGDRNQPGNSQLLSRCVGSR